MAQFHAYENPNKASRKAYPFLLDIQSNLVNELQSTIVIPLAPCAVLDVPIARLMPKVQVKGSDYFVMTQQIAGYERKLLGKSVADLSAFRYEIIAAIDFVISGI